MEYLKISKENLEEYFNVSNIKDKEFKVRIPYGVNSIKINIPFTLNEDIATLAGLMPDGSLIKDLRRIYFTQKKDVSKIYLFRDLLCTIFSPSNKIFIKEGGAETYTNSKTLANFFYHILDLRKSDEETRIPSWIFNSPVSVKYAYLRAAYDMEAYMSKRLYEIRFITVDKNYAYDLKKLLESVNITSIVKTRIGGTHKTTQYRISIYGKENIKEFGKIGFSIRMHKERLERALAKYS
ncbi:MAG: LAGLIDADG family homing endonuclease [Nanoarchaeota archaeon]